MAQPANPHAMAPAKPGPTRTAAPMKPGNWPSSARYRTYLGFDFTGLVYLLAGFAVLGAARAFAKGPDAWNALLASYKHPLWILFHLLVLASVVFVGVRFFRLFPKAQPPQIGPAKPPPRPLIHAGLYAAWIGATIVLAAILGGVIL
jgi:fumarate reductase subunit C